MFVSHITSQIIFFLETNTSAEISHSTLWETLKAYLHGQIIEYSSRAKKLTISTRPPHVQHFLKKGCVYRQNTTYFPQTAIHLITMSRFAVYDSGDKAGKLLAQQARQAQSTRLIPKIYSETGGTSMIPSKSITAVYTALNSPPSLPQFSSNPVVYHSVRIWSQFRRHFNLQTTRLILLSWKDQAPPNFTRWIRDTMHFLKLEKIRYTLKGSVQKFTKIWTPFLNYYDSLQIPLNKDD
ncbi:hypothetical protein F7725_007486 [Dissostichus mawsoni]|uniref:Uncharacterized protein n=1 Tax=Dissostichus mawsoni TaxID=36200 RepID=A0A7J5Y5F3_DISMA|nr:hypothetical protein F7725_007486 [Dissostichus mawsoni]